MHAMLNTAAVAFVALACLSAPAAQAQIGWDRACLTSYVDTWFHALFANDPGSVPLAPNARITHNGKEMALGATFWDIANIQLRDTGTEAVVLNADGTKTMPMLRLKVVNGAITEVETIKTNEGEAYRLWGPDQLTTSSGFDQGRFIGRNIWDRRYPVVDTERGIVLSIVRFGLKDGMESQSIATSNPRLVGEFFAVKAGMISEIHAVLFNLAESASTGWEPEYGPPRGGAGW